MKTKIITLIGDINENLYQIGRNEQESFEKLRARVHLVLSSSEMLRYGNDILSRARAVFRKNGPSFFHDSIQAYSSGLGIEASEYLNFLSLFEIAAHYGQLYPEIKGLFPGCTSVFEKMGDEITHSRLVDFSLVGIFDTTPRLYYWKTKGRPSILNFSCEGLAPVFFQAVHENGMSLALHHKPGTNFNRDGENIFQISFDTLFNSKSLIEIKKEIKSRNSMTKWGFYCVDQAGSVLSIDIEGPSSSSEIYNLKENSLLIFNNIPIRKDPSLQDDQYLNFCLHRTEWLQEKMKRQNKLSPLDLLTDVKDTKSKRWTHPTATLSSLGAFHINLTQGKIQIKESDGAIVGSDPIYEFSLADRDYYKLFKPLGEPTDFEKAWKMASLAQGYYDQGLLDHAYHYLQMAISLMSDKTWKQIFDFFLCAWNFKFITHRNELSIIYKNLKGLELPPILKNQWYFLVMRFEKKMGLEITIKETLLPSCLQGFFRMERDAPSPIFATWMKLIYPRLDVLDIFSPHHR